MYAIVGLGNVGDKYKFTRHNAGFMFVDMLPKSSQYTLLKPDTMMNSSGVAVKKLINYYKMNLDDLYIAHDDLDLRLGEYKIQKGRGPKVHNGVNSVEERLGTEEFWRVRIGVDNRDPENRIKGEDYVLQNFSNEEMQIIKETIKNACSELLGKING